MGDNRIPDDIFKRAVVKARKIETSVFEKRFKDTDKHTFSEYYLDRIQILKMEKREEKDLKITNSSVKRKSTKVKILLIAAIVMLMGTMAVLAVEPLREIVYKFIETIFPDHTYVYFEEMEKQIKSENENMDYDSYPRDLQMVPAGYTLYTEEDLYEETGVYDYIQIFHNEDMKSILYEQIDINELDLYSLIVSSDGTAAEEIAVCGEIAYALTDEVQRNTVLYARNGFLFLLSGQEDIEILVECLESIFEE